MPQELSPNEMNTMSLINPEGEAVSIQYSWDTDVYDVMNVVKKLLIAGGFHPETVQNGFKFMVDEEQ
jgi:hypothetical protein